jgi:lipopolysaccharide transport system permease protein
VVTQAGFFIAPIIYPLGILPERVHAYLYAWPPTPIILFSRSVLVDGRIPSPLAHGLLFIETAMVLGAGLLVYRARVSRVAEEL